MKSLPTTTCLHVRAWLALVALPTTLLAQQPNPKPAVEYVFTVDTDRPDAIYHANDTVRFQVTLTHNGQPTGGEEITWTISKDGVPPVETGKATLQNGQTTLTGKLGEPGFLRCEVQFKRDKQTFIGVGGAGVDPLAIKPSMPAPDDFDAFWAEKKKQLAATPLNPTLTPVTLPSGREGAEPFDMQVDCIGGKPMSGYYARPVGAKPHSLPAMAIFHGAGVDSSNLDQVCGWAKSGFLCIDINAHGIPNGKPREFYVDLLNGELKDYRTQGSASRDTYYFLGMYLRAKRALDFLTAQPEWNGRVLVVNGASQAGAQSLAAAALDDRVTYVVAIEPAMCDHTGMMAGRVAGWPKLVPKGADGKPDPALLQVARYFDSVNFAARVKAPSVYFAAGFLDAVCPPTTIYAAYNNLPAAVVKKEMHDEIHGGHNTTPRPGDTFNIWGEVRQRVLEHAAAMAK